MLYHIVISHRQPEYITKFPKGSVFVFDAITDADSATCEKYGYPYVTVDTEGNRGANRNAGLARVFRDYHLKDSDIVEFFDGDRFPVKYEPKRIMSLMDEHGIDCMLYTCETDIRSTRIHIPCSGATIIDTGTLGNPFYSCGFAMCVGAIRKAMDFNGGILFEERFTRWGVEDQYLGLVCDHVGMTVGITQETILNGCVGGDSDEHDDYRDSLQEYVDIVKEKGLGIRSESRAFLVV